MEKTVLAFRALVSGLTGVRPAIGLAVAGTIVIMLAPTATVMGKEPPLARDFERIEALKRPSLDKNPDSQLILYGHSNIGSFFA